MEDRDEYIADDIFIGASEGPLEAPENTGEAVGFIRISEQPTPWQVCTRRCSRNWSPGRWECK